MEGLASQATPIQDAPLAASKHITGSGAAEKGCQGGGDGIKRMAADVDDQKGSGAAAAPKATAKRRAGGENGRGPVRRREEGGRGGFKQ